MFEKEAEERSRRKMEVFEAGYAAKEKEIIDKVIADAEKCIKEIE